MHEQGLLERWGFTSELAVPMSLVALLTVLMLDTVRRNWEEAGVVRARLIELEVRLQEAGAELEQDRHRAALAHFHSVGAAELLWICTKALASKERR